MRQWAGILAIGGLLAACGDDELILPGVRLDLRDTVSGIGAGQDVAQSNLSKPISLPTPVNNSAWTHRGGTATHLMRQTALGQNLSPLWSISIGQGDSRRNRITADPVISDGRIFTADSQSTVSAVSTSGILLWSVDLIPANDKTDEVAGGGLAVEGDTLVVTTGSGRLVALNVNDGAVIWQQRLESQSASAPTIRNGIIYVSTRDSRAWAINLDNGRVRWQVPGTPSAAGVLGGASPAVTGDVAIFPFGSGEVLGTFPLGGVQRWASSVSGQRLGYVSALLDDITGDPVISGETVYVGNQAGRLVALDVRSGERKWTANEGAFSPVWPAGNSVFLISDLGALVRLDASTGQKIWAIELPYYTDVKAKKRDRVYAHYGPILAGGRLIVASNDGLIRSFDPVDGALLSTVEIPGGATTHPAVAEGTLYVVSAKGQLHAFR